MELIHSYGVGSSRYISCLNDNNNEYIITLAIGSSICKWDIKNGKQLLFKKIHNDVVTCLIHFTTNYNDGSNNNNDYYLSSSYLGEVSIYNKEWNRLVHIDLPLRDDISNDSIKIMHMSYKVDQNDPSLITVALSSEHGNCRIYIVQFDLKNQKATLLNTLQDNLYFYAELYDNDKVIVIRQDVGKDGYQDARTLKVGDNKIELLSLNWKTGEILKKIDSPGKGVTVVVREILSNNRNSNNNRIAISRGRTVQIIDMNTLDVVWQIDSIGSGLIKDLLFSLDESSGSRSGKSRYQLIVPSSNSMIYIYQSDNNGLDSRHYTVKSSHGVVYAMRWAVPNRRLWIFDESGLHNLSVVEEDQPKISSPIAPKTPEMIYYQLKFHEITCCGLDFNDQGNMIACGDFMGNLLLWSMKDDHIGEQPIQKHILGVPVRSLAWSNSPDQSMIIVGLMDGSLIYYSLETEKSTIIDTLNDGITAIQWHGSKQLLAVGTTGGNLYLYKYNKDGNITNQNQESGTDIGEDDEDDEIDQNEINNSLIRNKFELKWKRLAHSPIKGEQDDRFGSIIHFAEIWSLCFSDDGESIATSSEDQTVAIWNSSNGDEPAVAILRGHSLAVTSVDWHDSVLASCADDHTICIWNTNDWSEPPTVYKTTNDVGEWHTVTYLSLVKKQSTGNNNNHNSYNVVCATQNGWIFIWDLNTKSKIFSKRVHLGSIEGLKWNKQKSRIISCSSDCLIHVYQITDK